MNCEQDTLLTAKELEIASLKAQVLELQALTHPTSELRSPGEIILPARPTPLHATEIRTVLVRHERHRRGKAPPIDPFDGDNLEVQIDDWLPALKRAATWNEWTEEELLMQLAGHLRGRALQEWILLGDEKITYDSTTEALRSRLDRGSRVLAAQDFRHTLQRDGESVSDFIMRLERTFRIAYGRESMSVETRETFLHSQLQEGLRYDVMKGPAVSGAQTYRELCVAARNEEKLRQS